MFFSVEYGWYLFVRLHGVVFQKTIAFNRTPNLTTSVVERPATSSRPSRASRAAWCIPAQWRSDSCEIAHLVVMQRASSHPDQKTAITAGWRLQPSARSRDWRSDSRPWLAVPLITVHWCTLIHVGLSRTEYLVCYLMILYQTLSTVSVVRQAGCLSWFLIEWFSNIVWQQIYFVV